MLQSAIAKIFLLTDRRDSPNPWLMGTPGHKIRTLVRRAVKTSLGCPGVGQ